ncbi:hypothetical protein DL765_006251 [Monosporascus sp. GIB2]|nr:hypothetical protein DL765_006251 [Monosporascus sp. GIB2]
MPTFITKEQSSCGHGLEMVHRRTGSDGLVLAETLPVPLRCLSCICQELLDASIDGMPCIPEVGLEDLKQISPLFEADIAQVFDFEKSVERRSAQGGTSRSSVLDQIDAIEKMLS